MKIRSALAVALATFGAITITAIPAAALDGACGMVITDRGTTVTFTSNLDCGIAPGITIAADDVAIDLGGHTYEGTTDNPYGFRITGPVKRPTITNGTISGFQTAIDVQSAYELSLTNLRIKSTAEDGIDIADSAYVTVDNVTLDRNVYEGEFNDQFAIQIDRSHDMEISNVHESGWTGSGITVRYSHDYTIRDSSFFDNDANNIAIENDTLNALVSNVTTGDAVLCVVATFISDPGTSAPTVTFDHVVATHCNEEYGFGEAFNVNWSYNVVLDGVESHGSDAGIDVAWEGANVVVRNSLIENSIGTGIVVQGSSAGTPRGTVLTGNTVTGSGSDGYLIRDASVALSANAATGNGGNGFVWTGSGGGTSSGDTATSNGQNGFAWTGPRSTGTSSGDTATSNGGSGFLILTSGYGIVGVENAKSTHNAVDGLELHTGRANVSGGKFNFNTQQGIYALSGRLNLSSVTASYNTRSGVYYGIGSAGTGTRIHAVKNRLYGLAAATGSSFVSGGGHYFYRNGIANRCTGTCTL